MFKRWRLGTILGFPVELNLSFLILLGVVFVWLGGLAGVAVVCLAFASVLLHELGHAVVARWLGVRVSSIELSFFGGAAKMVELPRTANHEVAIAAAGPAVSLMLAGLGLGLGAATGSSLVSLLGWINLVIAGFNLLPALPMDGGRILRALLSRRMSFVAATDLAVKLSRGLALAMVVAGLAWGSLQLVILAPVLWVLGTREQLLARMVAERYRQGPSGYAERAWDEPVVVSATGEPVGPRGWGGFGHAFQGGPFASEQRFVIRQVGGRFVVERR
ncbi:MAG: M50 family metallopeptidase [Kofleriaceae bacterium]